MTFRAPPCIKFNENPSRGRPVVLCEQTDGWTEMTTIIVAFRNFANVPKNRKDKLMEYVLTAVYISHLHHKFQCSNISSLILV